MSHEQHRRDLVLSFGARRDAVGLEFGPLDRPIARRPEFDVRYVDVFDTEGVREHYRLDPGVVAADIPVVDFPLYGPGGTLRSLVDAVAAEAPYGWAIASHVVEHVPDMIGWLNEIAEVLDDAAALVLVVPDRRYSFDAGRPETTVGQLLQAHRDRDTVPSVRAVYDHFREAVQGTSPEFWAGRVASPDDRLWGVDDVRARVLSAERGEYVDSHVWVFTPDSFLAQIAELGRLGMIEFAAEQAAPTAPGGLEFFVRLTRIPRTATADQTAERLASAVTSVEDRVPGARSPASEVHDGPARYYWASDTEIRLIDAKRRIVDTILRRRPRRLDR